MAQKKAQSSSHNTKDSRGRRLGVKKFGGELISPGNIIIRQRGTRVYPGEGAGIGRDHTIFALKSGVVTFVRKGHSGKSRQYVCVLEADRQ